MIQAVPTTETPQAFETEAIADYSSDFSRRNTDFSERPDPLTEAERNTVNDFEGPSQYLPLPFEDPINMYGFFSTPFQRGDLILSKWQLETCSYVVHGIQGVTPTAKIPLKFLLRACNGSGKDAFFTAPLVVFLTATCIRHRSIVTSSSDNQLNTQTEAYIRTYAQTINDFFDSKIFIIKRRHIICSLTGSEIVLFATDEAGRAEGFHPFPDYPDTGMLIAMNEAKSIEKDIYQALRRCNGFNRWVEVSSPGQMEGEFYENDERAIPWDQKEIAPYDKAIYIKRKIPYTMCPHLQTADSENLIEVHGKDDPWIQSMLFANFSNDPEGTIIDGVLLAKNKRNAVKYLKIKGDAIGLDFSMGGDALTYAYRSGNTLKFPVRSFRESKAQKIADQYVRWFIEDKVPLAQEIDDGAEQIVINGDDGGVGKPIIDLIEAKGYRINRITNNSPPTITNTRIRRYGNMGAQMYFTVRFMLTHGVINLDTAAESTRKQLRNRRYERRGNTKYLFLEKKEDLRRVGRPSPDEADALVLAFRNLTVFDFLREGHITSVRQTYESAKMTKEIKTVQTIRTVKNEVRGAVYTLEQLFKMAELPTVKHKPGNPGIVRKAIGVVALSRGSGRNRRIRQ